jgi:AcrR family transcriptional regulator
MRYSAEHKQQTRERIMDAAARVFREDGFGGAGIDGLTKAAGVTNGAFYGHFKTKTDAFREAVVAGLNGLRTTISAFRAEHGAAWIPAFARFYLGPRQEVPLGEACALPTLSPEVMRADPETRTAFSAGLQALIDAVAAGRPEPDAGARQDAAIVMLALLAGGAMLGRAVNDPALAARINRTIERAAEMQV